MSLRRSALLLWCVLISLLPLPICVEQWGWWPLLRLLTFSIDTVFDIVRVAQLLGWSLLLAVIAFAYGWAGQRLPPKWAGALVGLFCWSLLVALSTVALYRDPLADSAQVTLREIYRSAAAVEAGP